MKIWLLIIFSSCIITLVQGQPFPVNITIGVSQPYTSRINDYIAQPNKVMATLINTSSTVQTVYLLGKVSDGGKISVYTDPKYKMPQPVVLQPKTPYRLNLDNLGQIFSPDHLVFQNITKDEILYGNGLSEGDWMICIRAFDYKTGEPLSAEDPQGCSNTFTISDVPPPEILQPECGIRLPVTTPQMLNIVWNRPVGAPMNTQYLVKIYSLPPGIDNIDAALQSGRLPVFYEPIATGDYCLIGPAAPSMEAGQEYVIVVTAFDPSGKVQFRNKGASAPCRFTWGGIGVAKDPCNCGEWQSNFVTFNGQGQDLSCANQLPACNTITISTTTTFNFNFHYSCVPDYSPCGPATYFWKLTDQYGGLYNNYTGSTNPFPVIVGDPGSYLLTIYSYCGGVECDSCLVNIIYDSVSDTCVCETVDPIYLMLNTLNINPNNTPGTAYNTTLPAALVVNPNGVVCSPANDPACAANYIIEMDDPNSNGFIPVTSGSLPISPYTIPFPSPGSYIFKIIRKCGSTVCDIDTVYIKILETPLCSCVIGTNKGKIKVTTSNGSSSWKQCDGTLVVTNSNSISSVSIHGYSCSPNNPVLCPPSCSWEIRRLDNTLITQSTGSQSQISFPLSVSLPYQYWIIFIPKCGSQWCTPCKLKIKQNYLNQGEIISR